MMLENSEDAIFILDSENLNAISANKAALQLFAYSAISEISTDTISKIIKMAQGITIRSFILDIKTSITFKRKFISEVIFVKNAGEEFIGDTTITLVSEGSTAFYICVIKDITDVKHTSMIQKFVFELSQKDTLTDREMSKLVLEKTREMIDMELAIFAYVDQENDGIDVISYNYAPGSVKVLPKEFSVKKITDTSLLLNSLIGKNSMERINAVSKKDVSNADIEINNYLYIPIVISNITKCFILLLNKKNLFTKRDMDFVAVLLKSFWPVLLRKIPSKEPPKKKINLEKTIGNSRSTERALKENQDRFKKLIATMSDEVWLFNKEGAIIEANESACKHTQYKIFDLLKIKFYEICPTVNKEEFAELFDAIVEEESLEFEGKFRRRDGSQYDFDMFANVIEMDNEKFILCTAHDVSEKKKINSTLRKNEKKYRTVLDQALEMIILCDIDGMIREANEITCKTLGFSEDELISYNIRQLMTNRTISYLGEILDEEQTKNSFELKERVLRKDGSRLVGSIRGKIIDLEDEKNILITIRDVAEEMRQEEKIRFLNFHDKVSGLYNKAFFEEEIKRLDLGINLPISIIMGDINGLKLINSTYGHSVGDKLINTVAYILLGCCRSEDIVARWGGDEFVILLPNADEKVCESICKTIEIVCKEYKERNSDFEDVIDPSISFGYATKEKESQDINEVMKQAEDFMYKKKMLDKKSMHSSIVHSMKNTLFEKNFDNEEYSSRLNIICRKIGMALGLSDSELNELELLSMLHDIGKIVIDAYVLNKDETLSDSDWDEIRKHPEVGYRIIKSSPELASVAEYVLSHHERWDGKGYPNGISGEQIPLKSRIIAVADAYAAMTQDKSYRKAMQVEQAKTELQKNMNTQFDEKIVKVFLNILENEKSL